ncbi:C-type lectin domain family 4 member M-like isoform X2 [Mercenaria mercenaria]|uniref:C-type lectin domain family 4 member M-like isoform X2 n=1 Tax=Mercenaria mercenaria TaxID=6596 RepID=UPI00234E6B52|nr:C-type lectin domain family 4 member M-like isoform X2 [Mercenaria mercenaria]
MELNNKVFLLVLASFGLVCGECLNGFLKHDDMCYHISHDTETWIDALVTCDKLYGAQLVEIETAKENDYLVNKTSGLRAKFWVGGNDLQVEGQWKWATSNEDVQFTAWGHHPSNSNRNENCMEIAGLTWNDNQCDRSQRYICEKPLNGNQIIG